MNNAQCIDAVKYYLTRKSNEVLVCPVIHVNSGDVMFVERSQAHKATFEWLHLNKWPE